MEWAQKLCKNAKASNFIDSIIAKHHLNKTIGKEGLITKILEIKYHLNIGYLYEYWYEIIISMIFIYFGQIYANYKFIT